MRARALVAVALLVLVFAGACGTDSSGSGPVRQSSAGAGATARSTAETAPTTAAGASVGVTGTDSPSTTGTTLPPRPPITAVHPSAGCTANMAISPAPTGEAWRVDMGGSRGYLLAVPVGTLPRDATPVIVLLHGRSSTAQVVLDYTRLAPAAARIGAVVVVPQAPEPERSWAATDVAALAAVLDHLEATRCVDRDRVWVAGLSMGGFMAARLACELAPRFAAVATVAGLGYAPERCGAAAPTPLVAFHGTADAVIPFSGRPPSFVDLAPSTGAAADTAAWAAHNRCAAVPADALVAPEVTRRTWSDCAADTELYVVRPGGHSWPGAEPDERQGYTTSQVSASDVIVDFFARHPATAPR